MSVSNALIDWVARTMRGPTFSSSISFLALILSSLAIRLSSSSSRANFLLAPAVATTRAVLPSCIGGSFLRLELGSTAPRLVALARPACIISKSRIALVLSSSSSRAVMRALSCSALSRVCWARLSSFFWATRLARAHSRQKMSPRGQATGSLAISRHRPQEPKGRKESRLRRAELAVQLDLARARSWDVKTGREVFLLPGASQWGDGSW